MPVYVYECVSCGTEFEIISLSFNESNTRLCPECGQEAKRKVAIVNSTFGWRPSDAANERFGPREEMVRDV